MQIRQLLDGVENLEMVIPEFQREYVWSLEYAKQLMVSLFKGYPTGSLLFWETNNPPEIKNQAVQRDRIGLTKVILDGQQRLTTLYLLIRGKIPPYYTEKDLANDPRNLYFSLETGEFQYYMKTKMEGSPLWQSVIDCYDSKKVDAYDITEKYCSNNKDTDFKSLMKTINNNLNKLRSIEQIDYLTQVVPSSAKVDEAIDVFDRVNSKGTKLTDAELVLTHITGKWPQARRILKDKISQLKKENFDFSLEFLTRCMVVSLTESALYDKNSKLKYEKFTKDDYIDAWGKVSKALDYLVPILKQNALISGTNDMNTVNVLVPIMAYLLRNDNKFPENIKYGFLYWMFLALIWSRYSGQTDQRLDKDVYLAINGQNPIPKLVNEIEDQRGRLEIKPTDLEGRGSGHPLFRMLYIITKYKKAIDWSNGSTIYGTIGDYYSIQNHYIFPQSVLYNNKYNSENHLDKKKVNEIANRAFITRDTKYELSNKYPHEYLEQIETKYPGALERQFIPKNKSLWNLEKYEDFLIERRKLIADEMNIFLETLKNYSSKEEQETIIDLNEIIRKGENDFVEFKSSLRWDYKTNQVNKILEYVIAKTISAFLNSEGGKLFIGVDDEGNILGIEKDYTTLGKKQNKDEFQQKLIEVINNYIGKEYHQYISIKIDSLDNNDVCIVDVSNSNNPVYLNNNGEEEFYIRASSSSQPMGIREAYEYIKSHWNKE